MELKSYNDLKTMLDKVNISDNRTGFPILVYGAEKQLIKDSIKLIYNLVQILPELNIVILEESYVTYDEVVNACETLPMMSDIKIVHIKNPYFFKKSAAEGEEGKKNSTGEADELSGYIVNYIKSIPQNIVLLLSYEDEIDSRNKILTNVKSKGYILEYKLLKGEDLNSYITGIFEKNSKKINKSDLLYFIGALGNSIEQIELEAQKLCAYALDEEFITRRHIDDIVHKGIENNIFKMVDSISNKNADTAISILDALLFQKEEPLRILGMIIRQYRILYLVYMMVELKKSPEEIKSSLKAKKINLMDFVINNMIKQSRNYDASGLRRALMACFNADEDIKSNRLNPELVLETLVVKLCR